MDELTKLLQDYKNGKMEESEVVAQLRKEPFSDIGIAKLDYHRALRSGYPEVVFGLGKTVKQIITIVTHLYQNTTEDILITKTNEQVYRELKKIDESALFHKEAGIVQFARNDIQQSEDFAVILTAGTSDIPIASEAAVTARAMGCQVKEIFDVGVCGVHRLLHYIETLQQAKVIVVIAGMEGALCSVTAGLVSCPVIGVPTSVGYGASFGGVAALLSMINSCANRVSVVNIDNGYGAGCIAASIVKGAQG